MSKTSVKDSVLFITGTNRKRSLGRAFVNEAVKRGAKKVYAAARDSSQVEDLVSEHKGVVVPITLDVTNKKQIEQAAKDASDTQILINCAGLLSFTGICYKYDEKEARQEFEVNYWGPLNTIRAFATTPVFKKKGVIVNIGSICGFAAFPLQATYCTTKGAIYFLTRNVRAELAHLGVTVFGVYPGPIDTDMADDLKFDKETSAYEATKIFDGMAKGEVDIIPDKFGQDMYAKIRKDPKIIERKHSHFIHKPSER